MERVTNSVQQIEQEVNELLKVAEELPYTNVILTADFLKKNMEELKKDFSEHPENVSNINFKKTRVESCGLNLEYFIQCYSNEFKDRYKLRCYVNMIRDEVYEIFSLINRKTDKRVSDEVLLQWASNCAFCLRLQTLASHLMFSLTDEDEVQLKDIVDQISVYHAQNPLEFRRVENEQVLGSNWNAEEQDGQVS